MTACKYWDCGWCYAPNYLKTNSINSACVDPNKCPISPLSEPVQYKTPMTDTHDLRNQWFDNKSEPVKYETPMTEIEEVKSQIKVLEAKLSFLEELERTKSPVEEAYKRVYGYYPVTNIDDTCWDGDNWMRFEAGYIAAQKDYKVGEYQEPEPEKEPEELKTLFQMFYNRVWIESYCDEFCNIVKEWMSQYTHNVMSGEYLEGYNGCLDVLKENLK